MKCSATWLSPIGSNQLSMQCEREAGHAGEHKLSTAAVVIWWKSGEDVERERLEKVKAAAR